MSGRLWKLEETLARKKNATEREVNELLDGLMEGAARKTLWAAAGCRTC